MFPFCFVDPDDAFSSIPYEKGFNLLFYLEKVVGGPSIFEPYIKAHVEKFQHQSITSEEFREFFLEFFAGLKKEGKLDQVDWKTWFHSPGFPPTKPEFDQSLAEVCSMLSERWERAKNSNKEQAFKKEDFTILTPEQKGPFSLLFFLFFSYFF